MSNSPAKSPVGGLSTKSNVSLNLGYCGALAIVTDGDNAGTLYIVNGKDRIVRVKPWTGNGRTEGC